MVKVYNPKPSSELVLLTAASIALAAWLLSAFADLPWEARASASGAVASWVSEAPPGMSGWSNTLKLALSSLHRILRFNYVLLDFLRRNRGKHGRTYCLKHYILQLWQCGKLSIFEFNYPRTCWLVNWHKMPSFADIRYLGKFKPRSLCKAFTEVSAQYRKMDRS